jgi:hypothetical protein
MFLQYIYPTDLVLVVVDLWLFACHHRLQMANLRSGQSTFGKRRLLLQMQPCIRSTQLNPSLVALPLLYLAKCVALAEAHMRWGKLPWRRLVQPKRRSCSGWAVGKELGLRIHVSLFYKWDYIEPDLSRKLPIYRSLFLQHPDWRHVFAPDGVLLREGDAIRNANLSRTLVTNCRARSWRVLPRRSCRRHH